jgi:quercetin dioxygenase-like cupin family protein
MENDKNYIDPSTPIELASFIEYSDNSIVSRIISKNKAGNITCFAFDKDEELSEHTTPYDAIVQIIEGEAELTIGGKPIIVSAGQFAMMSADIPHTVKAVKKFKMLLTMLKEPKE